MQTRSWDVMMLKAEAATTTSQSRAKAKSADPAGQKRKPESEKEAATAPSPSKAKAAEPAGEKRKADSDVEDVEETVGKGSPMKARLDEDEDIRRAQGTSPATTSHATTLDLLELHSGSGVAEEAKTFGMNTVDLREGWDLDKISDRNRLLEYVREKKPAFVIGRPQCNMFSRLQNMNAWTGKRRQQYNEAVGHMKFVFEISVAGSRG